MICYSDAKVTSSNHAVKDLIRFVSRITRGCGRGFVIRLHLLPLISGQMGKKFPWKILHPQPNTAKCHQNFSQFFQCHQNLNCFFIAAKILLSSLMPFCEDAVRMTIK